MIDVKKLIVGFLILAAAAGGSGFIFSYISFDNAPSSAGATSAATQVAINTTSSSSLSNFFPTEQSTGGLIATLPATSTPSNNLTSAFANDFMNGVVSANPNGLTNDNGIQVLIHPNTQSVADQVVQSPALGQVGTPNWIAEADAQPIITTSSNPGAISSYSQNLTNIFNQGIVANNIENIIKNPNITSSELNQAQQQIQATLNNITKTPTPQELVPLQKSLITMMVYDKNIVNLASHPGNDPLKSVMIFQNEQSNYNQALQTLETQIKKASAINNFSFYTPPPREENKAVALLDTIVGIPTANAQWPVFNFSQFQHELWTMAHNTLLQILKNTLISIIQSKVVTWIQGNGEPRFIQNWEQNITNAYQQTALNYLNSKMSCGVYSGFLPTIQSTLSAYYQNNTSQTCANQFQEALGGYTLQQYQQYFQDGGFAAYGASNLPSGNEYGDLWFQAQIAGYEANQAAQTQQAQDIASNGLKGSAVCSDGSNPNTGTHTMCKSPSGTGDYTINNATSTANGKTIPPQQCKAGYTPVTMPNKGLCSNGAKPTVTTPAVFTGYASQSAIDASPKLAAAANDIAGLLNTVLGSLLSSLANTAINGANTAVNGGLLAISANSISQSGTTGANAVPKVPLSCNPTSQTSTIGIPFTVVAQGGSFTSNDSAPTYYWTSPTGKTSSGSEFSDTINSLGTYQFFLTDSTGDATSTCSVVVVPAPASTNNSSTASSTTTG